MTFLAAKSIKKVKASFQLRGTQIRLRRFLASANFEWPDSTRKKISQKPHDMIKFIQNPNEFLLSLEKLRGRGRDLFPRPLFLKRCPKNNIQRGKMKFLIRFLILFCSLFLLFHPLAAEAGPFKRPFSFQHFTLKEGLSGEMVYAIAPQGDEVWFGTYGGGATLLNRSNKTAAHFTTKGEPQENDDGVSIKWKNHPAYNHVWVILPDKDRIWFGTYFYGFGGGGISYYRAKKKKPWRAFNTNQGRAKKVVSMAVNEDLLWVGSEKGLSVLDKKTERWKSFFSTEEGLAGNFVNALLLDEAYLWIGTNAGINRMGLNDQTLKTYRPRDGSVEFETKSLAKVNHRIWAGSPQGTLLSYDPAKDAWEKMDVADPLKDGGLHSIAVIKGAVFICRDNGVSVYHPSVNLWETITRADGLLSNTVFCAVEEKDGVWFGTDQGASRLILVP